MKPDLYECPIAVPAGEDRTITYRPRDGGTLLGFFFDRHSADLVLASVLIANQEQLVGPVSAVLFVMAVPRVTFPLLRIGVGADLVLRNPTDKLIDATLWIGERGAVVAKLARLQATNSRKSHP